MGKHCKHGHKKHCHDKCNVDIHVSRVHKIKGKVKTNVSGNIIQISGQQVEISGQPVTVSGNIVQISGQQVDISGQAATVSGNIVFVTNLSGQTISVNISGIVVSISGATLVTTVSGSVVQISGQEVSVFTNSGEFVTISGIVATSVSGNIVQISGQGVLISGQAIVTDSGSVTSVSGNIVQISGQVVTTNVSGNIVQISGQVVTTSISGNIVKISGQEVSVFTNSGEFVTISGIVATSVSGNIVQISGQAITTSVSGNIVQISGQVVTTSVQISGQAITTSVSGNIVQISGQGVLISGQAIVTDSGSVTSVSGNIVQIASGQTITATANISGQHVGVFGTTITLAEQDIVTNAFTEIGHPHDDIHEGKDFITSDVVTGLASGTAKNYLVITSSPKIVHMLQSVSSAPGSTVRFIENPTVTVNGSGLSVINHSRVSGIASITSVFSNTVFTSGTGTLLEIEEIGSATSAGKFGGETSADRNEAEWDLKTSGLYVLNIVALANNTDISTKFRWYEV